MFKIGNRNFEILVAALGFFVAMALVFINVGCGGVTAAPSSKSVSSTSIKVTPSSVSLVPGATQQFSAVVGGGSSSGLGLTWSATGGTVSTGGLYTAPTTPGTYTVQATSTANSSNSGSATVTVLGSTTTPQVLFAPAQLSFGTVAVNTTSTQTLQIKNAGAGTLTISNIDFTGDNVFAMIGTTFPFSIAAGKSASVPITFAPTAPGSFAASLAASSNASNSSQTVPISGTAAASTSSHSVSLNWTASNSNVVGYFVYRGTVSGGPYSKLITASDPATTYTDTVVQSGATYYYVVTALDGNGMESAFSNQATAAVP